MCGKHVAAVLFPVLLAACGGGPAEPVVTPGSATVTTTGAVSTSGGAVAIFQSMSFSSSSFFQLTIIPSLSIDPAWEINVSGFTPRPAVGTYSLALPDYTDPVALDASFDARSGGSFTSYLSTSGELVITSSTPSAVRGTMHFTASDSPGSSTARTMSVDVAFTASCIAPGQCQ